MIVRVAINGFGRIGRLVFRALVESKRTDIEVVAVNDLDAVETAAYLLQYDSVHGRLPVPVSVSGKNLVVGGRTIAFSAEANPDKLPWKEHKIDVVLECTGRFTDKASASKHIAAGARKVVISAPADGVDRTIVYGVNHTALTTQDTVISNASCTTNCLAPLAFVLHRLVGIRHGYMTTIHSYTGDQKLVDTVHKDLRRARAAAVSMIPTSTGAAKAVGLVLPELKGKLDGTAIRVPTPNVSLVDFKFVAEKPTTAAAINDAMLKVAEGDLKGIISYTATPLVSIDFNHEPFSTNFDATGTQVIDGTFCRVLAWYDNEWGFSNRMLDTTAVFGRL
ncbi:MAG: type I glyceraldehyde-3-phosphate dehydrogenase [Holosporales bacterium]